MTTEQKEKVGEYLFQAMKNLDKATAVMWNQDGHDDNAVELSKAKAAIKKVLNKDYDFLAISKNMKA